jgi:hypothetical protein
MRLARTHLLRTFTLLVLLLTASVMLGQVLSGTITGTVTDPSGAVVPNAKIKATDPATGQDFSGVSNSAGEFTITGVPNGSYNVVISAQGFSNFVVTGVQVNVSQVSRIAAKLTVGAVGTEVSVVAEQAVVQTETAEVKYAIDRTQIQNLQLPNRNPLDIVRILPGMATPTGNVTGGDVIVHGLRANSTNITLDGINIADNYVKTSSFFGINAPVLDTIGEVNVSTSGVGVDAGFGAAQVSMRTARGGNALHGAVYWFQRNSFLNANTFFNKQSTPITKRPFALQNRLGFSVGGPVFAPKLYNGKNKTFFFLSFEAFRYPAAQTITRTVLTDDARNGFFSFTGANDNTLHRINLLTGIPAAKIGTTGLPVQINAAYMNLYKSIAPAYNSMSCSGADQYNIGCYLFNAAGGQRQNRYAARIDHNLTDNHSIEFAFNQQNYFSWPDFLNSGAPMFSTAKGGGTGQESKRQLFSWALHSNFGTNKTNEARFGMTRAPVMFSLKEDYSPENNIQIVNPLVSDISFIQGNMPQGRNTPVRQFTDNFAWVRGHHTIKLGGEWRNILAESIMYTYTQYPRVDLGTGAQSTGLAQTDPAWGPVVGGKGNISSTDLTKAQNLFAMVTGLLTSTRQGYNKQTPTSGYVTGLPLKRDPTQFNLAGYAQDSWKMFPNFSLEYGVRWEYQGVYHERNGLALQPVDPVSGPWGAGGVRNFFNVLSTPAATDVTLQYVAGSDMRSLYHKQYTNFAPFIGFAWDPFKDGKTSIRGGWAMHYTQDGFTVFNNAVTYADGLRITPINTGPTGVFNPSSVPWPAAPAESFSQATNFKSNTNGIIVGVKPDLKVPYVIEWNFGVQREIAKRVTVELRYVGNHAVKQYRMWDVNQLNLYNNPFSSSVGSVSNAFTEFKNAQANYTKCGGTSLNCAGSTPLPILAAIFTGNSGMTSSTVLNYVRDGQVGNLYNYLRRTSPYYQNVLSKFPLNFFVPNPWTLNSIIMDNSSWSRYDAMELEVRRRFSSGLTFQANYTFAHGVGDQRFGTAQDEFQAYRDVTKPYLEKYRSPFDQRHAIAGQFIFPLPFGRGKWLGNNAPTWAEKIIGGWQLQGMVRMANGSPFTISSGRVTTGMANITAETAVLRNMNVKDLSRYIGTFKTPDRGVYWLNPASGLITFTTTSSGAVTSKPTFCVAGQTTPCWDYPGAGEMGNTSYFQWTGPFFWNQDFSVSKQIPINSISERFNFEVRVEMYNAFNHATFSNPTATLTDASKFGQLTGLTDTSRGGGVNSRNMAFQLRVNF